MAAPVQQGEILAGKYRVEKVLGEGGMGVVVAATDTQLERNVAIKFLLPEFAQHHEASQRFMREARAAVKIQSEHIARVIDVNTMPNGSPYMVMEFLRGGDLSEVIEQRGALPPQEAAHFVLQACDAIGEAHSYGIVHRDLKPANLFLALQPDGSSKVKVLDFGISKSTVSGPGEVNPSLTRTSSMMGSPLYMSPEQMKSTRDVDARTDIWALGVILYELLTAHLPFNAESIPELSAKILLEEPTPVQTYAPHVDPGLSAIVMRALQKDVNTRYPSISEFALDLLQYAPRQARANVERITKLLGQAGISTSSLASVPPPGGAARGRAVVATQPGRALQAHDATVAEFGSTNAPVSIPTTGIGKWVAVGAVALIVAGAGFFFALRGGGSEVAAGEQPEPETAVAAQPPPEAPPAVEEAAPEPEKKAEPEEKPEPKEEPKPAVTAAPKPVVKPAPKPVVRPRPKPTKTTTKSTATKSTATKTTTKSTTKSTTSSGGFKSKFGSRK